MANDFGPTGKFPNGGMNLQDEGELKMGVANYDGKVIMNFGSPVKSVGLEPQGAVDLATAIIRHAREAARTAGVVLTINV